MTCATQGQSEQTTVALLSRIRTVLGTEDRRKHERFNVPVPLVIVKSGKRGVRYKVEDWSVDGFKLASYHKEAKVDDILEGRIEFANGPQGTFVARVVHTCPDGSIGIQFKELIPPEFLFPVKE